MRRRSGLRRASAQGTVPGAAGHAGLCGPVQPSEEMWQPAVRGHVRAGHGVFRAEDAARGAVRRAGRAGLPHQAGRPQSGQDGLRILLLPRPRAGHQPVRVPPASARARPCARATAPTGVLPVHAVQDVGGAGQEPVPVAQGPVRVPGRRGR